MTRFTFSLLEALLRRNRYHYVLLTCWDRNRLPGQLAAVDVVTKPWHARMPLNALHQLVTVPAVYRQKGSVLEFNPNPVGCFLPFWPRIITVHDLYYNVLPQQFRWHLVYSWKAFLPLSLAAAHEIVCVSEATRRDLAKFYSHAARKSLVIHEASALTARKRRNEVLSDESPQPYFLYVCNISQNKDPLTLIKALKLLEDSNRPIKVLHVGRDEFNLLKDAQDDCDLKHRVVSVGPILDEDLSDLYAGCQAMISTSIYEGFCLPILEAQDSGAPVICTEMPVFREVAGDGALFFEARNASALSNSISQFLDSKALRQQLRRSSLINAAKFSWDIAAEQLEQRFDQIVGFR